MAFYGVKIFQNLKKVTCIYIKSNYNLLYKENKKRKGLKMKIGGVIPYDDAYNAGTVLCDKWLKYIEMGHFKFWDDFYKNKSIENIKRAKRDLLRKYRR